MNARERKLVVASACLAGLVLEACYVLKPSRGGAQIDPQEAVRPDYDPRGVALPKGYRMSLVASGLTFPTGVCFDADNVPCVVESGYSYGEVWHTPRLLRIADTRTDVIAVGGRNGPWNGVDWADGAFYVTEGGSMEGGKLLRIDDAGGVRELATRLPSMGDHHVNGPIVHGGWIYFGIGAATNSGVVGEDSAKFGWLARHPTFHDVPGMDVELAERTFGTSDALRKVDEHVETGAFSAFGTSTGGVIPAQVPCTSAVLRMPIGGGAMELVAWGFRNPYGLAFGPARDGEQGEALYVTDNGYDDRGSRPVWGTADLLWRVEKGRWYGWPDYSGDRPLTADEFRPPGKEKVEFLLASHPEKPPKPVAHFPVHCSADGIDFSTNAEFGHVGDAFVAEFGDQAPSTGKLLAPVGFKVVRVDVTTGRIEDFAVNKGKKNGPSTRTKREGLERPIAVRFDNTGKALYVVDFGVLREDRDGSHPEEFTGALWKIEATGGVP